MKRELLEAAYRLETASSLEKSWQVMVDAMASQKINRMFYIIRDDGLVANWFVLSNLPNEWPKFETNDPAFREPFVSYCCATFQPTKLGVEFLDLHQSYIDDYTRAYVATITEFDWRSGLGIPCRLVGSGRHGGFLMGNNMNRHDFERSIIPLSNELQTFCLIAHRKFEGFRLRDRHAPLRRPLSAREFQVLDLLSKGLRPKAIAGHLKLSEASIRLYIKNARLKLGVATNEEALMHFFEEKHNSAPT